uniref:Uncharacterized protein n=1 Tax=Sinocyclocheilus anshuiensis TaxID=1608454 RepID=A0A671ML78_9TELE
MITESFGKEILGFLEKNQTVFVSVMVGSRGLPKNINRGSLVFVSISFIVLMIISSAWLIFYFIQKIRDTSARDRSQVLHNIQYSTLKYQPSTSASVFFCGSFEQSTHRATTSFCSVYFENYEFSTLSEAFCVGGTALQRWSFQCRVGCALQAALPPVVLQSGHLPCAPQH